MSAKRTEPDPTPAAISHPTKKLKTDTLDSRPGDHLSDCTDPSCTGCAAGEIELTFLAEDGTTTTQPPAPIRLLHMALEEASLEPPLQHGIGMAKRLFDLAIEGFESLKKEAETRPQAVETRYAHATCLVEFGRYLPVEESAKEGEQLFQAIINDLVRRNNNQDTSKDTKKKAKPESDADATMSEKKRDGMVEIARVWVGLGKAKLVVAQLQRRVAQNNEPEDEYEGDEDGEDAEGGPIRLEITREESKLYKEAVECVEKGLAILNPRNSKVDASPFVRESILVAKELYSYGTLLDQPHHRDHAFKIFTSAIAQLTTAHAADIKALDNDSFFQGLWGACLYYQVKSMSEVEDDIEEAKASFTFPIIVGPALLQQAIDKLSMARKLADSAPASVESLAIIRPVKPTTELELLGQSYILLSTLAEDDDEVLEAFEKGMEHLTRASELDPDNEDLKKQLTLL